MSYTVAQALCSPLTPHVSSVVRESDQTKEIKEDDPSRHTPVMDNENEWSAKNTWVLLKRFLCLQLPVIYLHDIFNTDG